MNRTDAQALSKKALDELAAQLEAGKSESLLRFLSATARFHNYSWGNVMMIAAQRPNATRVAGVRTWNSMGRFVRKGEKGIGIFAPMTFKEKPDTVAADEERTRLAFRAVHVFDVSQTDGEPLPEPEAVAGDPEGYLERLKAVVSACGIRLEYSDALGSALGQSCKGTIKLAVDLTPAMEFSVLAHEIAHELIHIDRKAFDRKRAELEAEAVACVLCQYAGLESGSAHSDYIQLYQGGKEALTESLEVIQKIASAIIGDMGDVPQALAA
jgi:antirestriction protein ArdC